MIFNVGAGGASTAETIQYDNNTSGLKADNVQGAVDELSNNLGGLRFGKDGEGNYGYFGADDSLIPFKRGFRIVAGTFSATGSTAVNVDLGFKPKLLIVGNASNYNYMRVYNEEYSTTQQIMASTIASMSTINLNGDGGGGGCIATIHDNGFTYSKTSTANARDKRYIAVG